MQGREEARQPTLQTDSIQIKNVFHTRTYAGECAHITPRLLVSCTEQRYAIIKQVRVFMYRRPNDHSAHSINGNVL